MDLDKVSHSGEGAFYVQAGRRLTGRTKSEGHAQPSFGNDAKNKRFDDLRLVKSSADLQLDTAGAGYTAGDLIEWEGLLIRVDSVSNTGAISTWSLKRDHVYVSSEGVCRRWKRPRQLPSSVSRRQSPWRHTVWCSRPQVLSQRRNRTDKSSTVKTLQIKNHSSKKLSTDANEQEHGLSDSESTFVVLDRVPNPAKSLDLADGQADAIVALADPDAASHHGRNSKKVRAYAKLWSSLRGGVFAGGLFTNSTTWENDNGVVKRTAGR